MTIRAVFFDFGGVLGHWDREYVSEFEGEHGIAEGGVLKALYGTAGWRQVEVGQIAVDDWLAQVDIALRNAATMPVPPAPSVWKRLWNAMDQDVINLARRLRGTHKVGVLSNTTLMLEDEVLVPNGIHDMWDVIINSARVGVAKPDAGIYEIAAERVGFEPGECVHIDDLENNVRGAEAVGFKGVLHKGDFDALTAQLRTFGVEC